MENHKILPEQKWITTNGLPWCLLISEPLSAKMAIFGQSRISYMYVGLCRPGFTAGARLIHLVGNLCGHWWSWPFGGSALRIPTQRPRAHAHRALQHACSPEVIAVEDQWDAIDMRATLRPHLTRVSPNANTTVTTLSGPTFASPSITLVFLFMLTYNGWSAYMYISPSHLW